MIVMNREKFQEWLIIQKFHTSDDPVFDGLIATLEPTPFPFIRLGNFCGLMFGVLPFITFLAENCFFDLFVSFPL